MVSYDIKMRVAQNCPNFKYKYPGSAFALGMYSDSCDGCGNFDKNTCTKGVFDEMKKNVTFN